MSKLECELVYEIQKKWQLRNTMRDGNPYMSIYDEVRLANEILKAKFGKSIVQYSSEEIDNLVMEYLLLVK
jgi:hypothetical protein